MKNGMISWLVDNHVQSEADLDQVIGPIVYLLQKEDYIRIEAANTAFEKLFNWHAYNWENGMYIEHILPAGTRNHFCAALEKAAEKLWSQIILDTEMKKKDGTVLYCKAHIFCIGKDEAAIKYVVRFEYDLETQIKDALFTEALCQSRVNCWYWDMNQGTATFFNTDVPDIPFEKAHFMNESYVFIKDFPQGFVQSLNFAGQYRDSFMEFIKNLLSRKIEGEVHGEIAFHSGEEQLIWVAFTAQTVRNSEGIPEYAMGTWKNITDQKVSEQQQQHNNYLVGTLIRDSIYDITVNVDKNFFVADNSLEKWMEETRVFSAYYDQAMREIANERVVKEDREKFLQFFSLENIRNLPEDENISIEYRRKYKGRENWFKVTVNTFSLDEFTDKWMYVLVYDIDAGKRKEMMLEQMAATDALTGLYNRSHSLDLMKKHMQQCPDMPNAVVYMDLDNFKSVNDTLGHAAGDSLLICVADAMREYFGEDAVLGRIGGDEFILMCYNADHGYVAQMMNEFVQFVGGRCKEECPSIKVTVSLGYALYPDYGSDLTVLTDLADKALYVAKRHGKNMAVGYENGVDKSSDAKV